MTSRKKDKWYRKKVMQMLSGDYIDINNIDSIEIMMSLYDFEESF